MSQLVPTFRTNSIFLDKKEEFDSEGQKTGKIILNFATDAVNKHFQQRHFISASLTAQLGGCLQTKVDVSTFNKIKYLLKEDSEVVLTVCPAAWSSNGSAGTWFEFIELESAASLPNIA
jgi:hypothetical protein